MIKNVKYWQKFEKELVSREKINYEQTLKIMDVMEKGFCIIALTGSKYE